MTSRRILLALALTLPVWSQSDDSGPAPVQVVTRIASVDNPNLTSQNGPVTGLFLEIHNVSGKNVVGYSLGVKFIDPLTNTNVNGSHGRTAARQANPLRPGDCDCSNPKPVVIRKTASGALAEPKVTLDLVVFEDGTTWGAGQLIASRQLLKELGVTPVRQ